MNTDQIKAISTVKDTETYPEIELVQVDYDVRSILESEFPNHPEYVEEYSHLFVLVGNAEYDAIWGCNGIPYTYKDLDLLYPVSDEENTQMTSSNTQIAIYHDKNTKIEKIVVYGTEQIVVMYDRKHTKADVESMRQAIVAMWESTKDSSIVRVDTTESRDSTYTTIFILPAQKVIERVIEVTSESKKYNGWTNYETWNIALWLDNEQYTYEEMLNLARDARNAYELADTIKDYIEEMNPLADNASMFTDLLNAALQEVNWSEIAERYLTEIKEEEE